MNEAGEKPKPKRDPEPGAPSPEKSESEVETATKKGWLAAAANFETAVSPLLKALLVVTVFLGGFEYLQRQQSGRVEKSLALVEEWKAGGHRDAYQRINDRVWPLYAEGAEAIGALAEDAAQRALIFANIGETVTGQDDDFTSPADRDVDQVFYFFDRAALCANERICDYDVLATFLGEEAKSFWLYFSRYAERRQAAGYAQYGVWTARLAGGEIRRTGLFGLM